MTPIPVRNQTKANKPEGEGEFGRIARYFRPLAQDCPGALGLLDDAALVCVAPGYELVVTTDAMVAGVHFLATDAPQDIAAKLLRTNLSDVAAMAAEPLAYTLTTALPPCADDAWLAAFAAGLATDQACFGVHLAGGDSVSTPGPIMLSITMWGQVPVGTAITRASPSGVDGLYVTGTIGDAALGLDVALGRLDLAEGPLRAFLLERLRRPTPRCALAPFLRGHAGAAIDVSDGLVADIGHVAAVSGRAARIDAAKVPLSEAARAVMADHPKLMARVLTGGDDYELVFTATNDHARAIATAGAAMGLQVSCIGSLIAGDAGHVEVIGTGGALMSLTATGWNHFRA